MATNETRPDDLTREDEQVTRALDALPELQEYADGPELTLALGGDMDLIAEYGQDLVPFEEFDGTEWAAHVQDIIEWAEDAGFHVSVDSELHSMDLPKEGRVIVNASVQPEAAPLYMNVFCEVDGRVNVKLQVEPFEPMYGSTELYTGSVADLDVDALRETVDEHRPFVTGRARELAYEADVNPSHARAIALREVGFTHEQVADRLDITKGASGSYQSKFNSTVEGGEHLFIARTPVPRRVLAKRTFDRTNYLEERWYVCAEIRPPNERTKNPITVSIVKGDYTDIEGVNLNISTTGYESLRACIDALYAGTTFPDVTQAEQRHKLFTALPDDRLAEAGYDSLPDPASRVQRST